MIKYTRVQVKYESLNCECMIIEAIIWSSKNHCKINTSRSIGYFSLLGKIGIEVFGYFARKNLS